MLKSVSSKVRNFAPKVKDTLPRGRVSFTLRPPLSRPLSPLFCPPLPDRPHPVHRLQRDRLPPAIDQVDPDDFVILVAELVRFCLEIRPDRIIVALRVPPPLHADPGMHGRLCVCRKGKADVSARRRKPAAPFAGRAEF